MSIQRPPSLRDVAGERSHAYVVTVCEDGAPHTVYAPVRWEGDGLAVEAGARTAANAALRPAVSLLYAVRADGDYSLIVDGTADVESGGGARRVRVRPTRAVYHRPGPPSDPASSCGADCIPLVLPPTRR
jgi:hypothetical protein